MGRIHKPEPTNVTCKECGKYEDGTWVPEHTKKLRARLLCFVCDYWQDYVDRAADPVHGATCVRTPDGIHRTICDEQAPRGARGHGGRRFVVIFDDGRRVESTNVWFQGTIPEHFRARLPPNATIEDPTFSPPVQDYPF